MNTKLKMIAITMVAFTTIISCNKDDFNADLGGSQSPYGEVGNTINWSAGQFGISNTSMRVTQLEDGVSTFECSATSTISTYTDILEMMPKDIFAGTINITGNTITAEVNAKVTDEGIQVIFNDGSKLTLVNYDAKVGDKYTAKIGGVTLENEVVEKSTEDDYLWMGGMYLKVIKVKYKSHSPGINDVIAIYNHKYALVGLEIHFEDGSVKYVGCES